MTVELTSENFHCVGKCKQPSISASDLECCSVLQRVVVYFSVLWCVAVCVAVKYVLLCEMTVKLISEDF